MNKHVKNITPETTDLSRRSFLVGTASVAGGLSLGFNLPFDAAHAADSTPEVNAWVIVKPDETIVPTDQTYVENAKSKDSPVVGVARSVSGVTPTLYVFCFPRSESQKQMQFRMRRRSTSHRIQTIRNERYPRRAGEVVLRSWTHSPATPEKHLR